MPLGSARFLSTDSPLVASTESTIRRRRRLSKTSASGHGSSENAPEDQHAITTRLDQVEIERAYRIIGVLEKLTRFYRR